MGVIAKAGTSDDGRVDPRGRHRLKKELLQHRDETTKNGSCLNATAGPSEAEFGSMYAARGWCNVRGGVLGGVEAK